MRALVFSLLFSAGLFAQAQSIYPAKEWESAKPVEENMIADSLAAIDRDIKSGKYGYVDALFVTRNGKSATFS